MWEGLVKTPLGSTPMRKFVSMFATLLVAIFGYTLLVSTPVFAASAEWQDDQIVYLDNTYEGPKTVTSGNIPRVEDNSTYYEFHITQNGLEKAYIIYFTPGLDPPKEQNATLVEYQIIGNSLTGPLSTNDITITPQDSADPDGDSLATGELNSCQIESIGWIVCGCFCRSVI